MLGPTAAFLVRAGFLVVWLPLDVCGFRPLLARDWHDQLGRTVIVRFGVSLRDLRPSLIFLASLFSMAPWSFGTMERHLPTPTVACY